MSEDLGPNFRLRALFVTGIFPNPEQPELGTFNRQLARELRRLCDLTVIAPTPWFTAAKLPCIPRRWQAFGRIPRRFQIDGQEVLSPKFLVLPNVTEPALGASMSLGIHRTFKTVCRNVRPHVVMALYLYPDGVAASWLARREGLPTVLVGLGTDINRFLGERSKRKQILAALHRAAGVIVVSDSLRRRLVVEGVDADKVVVIPNGVDTDRFRTAGREEAAAEIGLPSGRRRILFVGRFAREKGPVHLLNAFARLAAEHLDVDLIMVGDGELRPGCEELVRDAGLLPRVFFAGFQPHTLVGRWLAASDLLCLPSLSEGCPNVVLEALACGRPVIGSGVGAVPELVSAASGLLVAPGDEEALAHALRTALQRVWDTAEIRAAAGAMRTWGEAAGDYCAVLHAAAGYPRDRP